MLDGHVLRLDCEDCRESLGYKGGAMFHDISNTAFVDAAFLY